MKLRAVTLSEVRQFLTPVRVSGIGDGVNVLAEPNESGKSTLFDAIHALFFIPHRSSKIRPLRPDIGGNPEITVEIEDDTGLLTLRKRWGRGAQAEVLRDGLSIARADEAEAMIAALTRPPEEGGPAGLLWVRQGLTEFPDKDSAGRKSREDLITSVTGEFEALTGGKRMDRARARAQDELDLLVTSRGPRAGGPLDAAVREVTALEARVAELEARAQRLQSALDERRRARRALADLTDPAETARRAEALAAAEAGLRAAELHASQVGAAAAALQAAALSHDALRKEIALRARTALAAETLTRQRDEARLAADEAATRATEATASERRAAEALTLARAAREAADAQVAAVLAARARQADAERRARLDRTLAEAAELAATLPALRQAAVTGPDAAQLERIDQAARDLAIAQGLAESAAPHLTFAPLPGAAPLLLGGIPLDETPRPVTDPVALDLPGLGTLRLDPGTGASAERLTRARAALTRALAEAGTEAPDTARAQARARAEAGARLKEAQDSLRRLAPEGIEALKAERDRLPAEAEGPATDPETAQQAARAAQTAEAQAQQAQDTARQTAERAREAAHGTRYTVEALAARLAEAKASLADLPAAALLDQRLAETAAARTRAEAEHQRLAAGAPDLALCQAALTRAKGAATGADAEIATLNSALAGLSATIATLSGEGVEADLAEARDRLKTAQDTRAALEREVAVLRTLIDALTDAQSAARDRYFEPVLTELRPMLRLLWPGAELRFDGESLLPAELLRDGKAEPIGSLSGGTREQISLLVRLAFARLLAKSGRHAPVILDDALVYTDDSRMEAMFNALTLQAQDLQILVLSCRNRALRDLGGRKLRFEPLA